MYKVVQIVEGNLVSEHPLTGACFSIGRNPGNDLQPDDASVSGNHAVIRLTPSVYLEDMLDVSVEDLGSTNGTFVNGERLEEHARPLHNGDVVRTKAYKEDDPEFQALLKEDSEWGRINREAYGLLKDSQDLIA